MHGNPVDERVRVLARRPEQNLQLVTEDKHELDLQRGEMIITT